MRASADHLLTISPNDPIFDEPREVRAERFMRRMATLEIVGTSVLQLKAFGNKLASKPVEAAAQLFVTLHREKAP